MRIAIFGGSFNPPHVAHQLACTCVLATGDPVVDQVWLVPTWKHPFDKQLVPFAERVAMCELAARVFGGRVRTHRIEEELGGESYTLNTIKALKARHPEHTFVLVIGADLVGERERWHGWPELQTLVPFHIVGRQGHPSVGGLELPPVSSTLIRERVAAGLDVGELVDGAVQRYIAERGLYRWPERMK